MPLDLRNPVLEGYLSGLAIRRQREQDAIANELRQRESERQDQETALNEQKFKAYLDNLKDEQTHRASVLKMQQAQQEQEAAMHRLQARKTVAEMSAGGMMRQPTAGEQNSSPIGGMIDLGGGVTQDPRTLPTPESMRAQHVADTRAMIPLKAEETGAVEGARQAAIAPFSQISAEQKRIADIEMQKLRGTQETQQIEQKGEIDRGLARLHGQIQKDVARIRMFSGMEDEADMVKAIQPYILGQATSNLGKNPRDRLMAQHINAAGFREFTAKDAEKLRAVHALDPLDDVMAQIMKTLPTSKVGAFGQSIEAKITASDAKNMKGIVASVAGQIAKTQGGESGRLTEDDINRAFGTLIVPGITVKQGQERLKFFVANRRSKVMDQILGGMSEKQKLMILIGGNNFTRDEVLTKLNGSVKIGNREVPKYKQDADGEILIADPQKGGYVSLDAAK